MVTAIFSSGSRLKLFQPTTSMYLFNSVNVAEFRRVLLYFLTSKSGLQQQQCRHDGGGDGRIN